MADTTVTVKQDGTGDYTTVSAAMAASDVSSGYYKVVIDDSSSYNESVNMSPATGTPTSSNYVWLTVSEGNRHSGVAASSGHARIYNNGSTVISTSTDSYPRIEYLEIESTATTHANPYVVYAPCAGLLVSRCIVHATSGSSTGTTHGILSYAYSGIDSCVDNCVVYNVEIGVFFVALTSPADAHIDYCTISRNGTGGTLHSNLYLRTAGTNTLNAYLYNTALGEGDPRDILTNTSASGPLYLNGSNNAWENETIPYGTNNLTATEDMSSGGVTTTTTTANAIIVTNLTSGSEDYTPVPATGAGSNLVLTNGVNRQGSEPDPRQDFSTDIRGKARPTTAGKIDIGAFQITTAAGFKYWDGSAWADSTNVQYWNGSAWTDVTGIQYWNGSAWTDPS